MIRFVSAAPKTGSSLITGAVILMQTSKFNPNSNYRLYPHWWKHLGNAHDWDLRPEIERSMIDNFDATLGEGGAIYKGHFWATQKNIAVLETAQGQCLVIVRSPIDTLVAQYCSMRSEPREARYNPIYPLRYEGKDVDEGIEYLITQGYLLHLLMFYAGWLHQLDDSWGIVMDYEGFLENPVEHLVFLAERNQRPYDVGVLERNMKILFEFYSKPEIDPEIYPRGWTAGKGVWKRYVSPENLKLFQYLYQSLLPIHPGMNVLDRQYPGGMA